MNIPKYIEDFRNEITRKGFRHNTVENYVGCLGLFLKHFDGKETEPKKINEDQIKGYLRSFNSRNSQRAHHSAIKCFFHYVLHQPNKFRYIEYAKKDTRLPIVFSVEEMQRLISACDNLKHKTIICLMYSAGLRISEVINLKIENIDSGRMIINIRNAKGGFDRQVGLDPALLNLLRKYYKEYKPKEYLFNGQTEPQYSERSIQQFLQKYAQAAGIKKHIHPHLLRHNCATHMVEAGTDINLIQKILGHKNVKTTNIYLHISDNHLSKIRSPLAAIDLG